MDVDFADAMTTSTGDHTTHQPHPGSRSIFTTTSSTTRCVTEILKELKTRNFKIVRGAGARSADRGRARAWAVPHAERKWLRRSFWRSAGPATPGPPFGIEG
jgi:hypothetical protein